MADPVATEPSQSPFRVLFVCTGNQCRSPFAQELFRSLSKDLGERIEVESAGVAEVEGSASPSRMLEIAGRGGIDLSRHRARALRSLDCSGFDLVIGFERQHVATAVVDGGAPADKTFLLAELIRLLEAVPEGGGDPDDARTVVAGAHAARTGSSFVPGEELDDPIGRSEQDYQRITSQVGDLVRTLERRLFRSGPGAGS
jgi:protein-tyrosine phosphatase